MFWSCDSPSWSFIGERSGGISTRLCWHCGPTVSQTGFYKSRGPDDINPSLLKALALQLSPSLTVLFNCSLTLGKVPSAFKQANIYPLLKPGKDPAQVASYSGLSLTSTLSKVLESIVREQICSFFAPDDLFSDQQFGFRQGHSCEDLLLATVDQWQVALNKGQSIAVAFLDLTKAFDNVQHDVSLQDLLLHHISGRALAWIADYLSSRTQRVLCDGKHSQSMPVQKGVPQGSVLGPILFNIPTAILFEFDCSAIKYSVIQ